MLNLIADTAPDGNESVNYEDISANVLRELHSHIENLPPELRKVFKFIYFKKKSISEIANILDITRQMVIDRKTKAIRQIQSEIFKKKSEHDH